MITFVLGAAATAAAGPAPCGQGKPDSIGLVEAIADPDAFVFVGRVTRQNVPPREGFEGQIGTIDLDVKTVLHGDTAKRVMVPAASERCVPKAACLPTMFDLAKPGTTIVVACVVPTTGAPRVAIAVGDAATTADVRTCLAIDGAADRVAALAAAYARGKTLARSCAARAVCDPARRAEGVAAVAAMIRTPGMAAETKLELAMALTQPAASAASALGCQVTPSFFEASRGGADPSNALIARTLLEGMLADRDVDHRHRWAGMLWGMMNDWIDHPEAGAKALGKLGGTLAARSIKMLRALGGPDAPHYESIASTIELANRP